MRRHNVLNLLIRKHGYQSYLEIGIGNGKNFSRIECPLKHGVDPNHPCTYNMTSDKFFKTIPVDQKYDIIFIDGLHTKRACLRDIENSLKHLKKNGTIVLHDCNPKGEKFSRKIPHHTHPTWYGDVFKAILYYRTLKNYFVCTVRTDCGMGIIKPGKQEVLVDENFSYTYKYLNANREKALNLISIEQFVEMVEKGML